MNDTAAELVGLLGTMIIVVVAYLLPWFALTCVALYLIAKVGKYLSFTKFSRKPRQAP